MHAIAVIPARFGSTRFPGKPLAAETGKPLIQHVVEQVRRAERVARAIVATDDRRIVEAVEQFGGEAMLTRDDHPNGTARIAEVASRLELDDETLILNVQGDEPQIPPGALDRLVGGLEADAGAPMATIASPFATDEDPSDPNIVKVVCDRRQRALYFSRALIPHDRDAAGEARPLKHAGVYAYRRWFLLKYTDLPATPLERTEKLEQLRALEHGQPIAVIEAGIEHHGIDTPAQYEAFVERMRDQRPHV